MRSITWRDAPSRTFGFNVQSYNTTSGLHVKQHDVTRRRDHQSRDVIHRLDIRLFVEADLYQGFRRWQSWFMAMRNKLNVEADPSQGSRVPSSDFWHTSGFYMRSNNMTWRAVAIPSSLSCEVQHTRLEAKPCQVFRWYVRCPLSVACCQWLNISKICFHSTMSYCQW